MATNAQIANDLAAQAKYWERRDENIARLCRDCARLIRKMLEGQPVDGRTYYGVQRRLMSGYQTRVEAGIGRSLSRALDALTELRRVTA